VRQKIRRFVPEHAAAAEHEATDVPETRGGFQRALFYTTTSSKPRQRRGSDRRTRAPHDRRPQPPLTSAGQVVSARLLSIGLDHEDIPHTTRGLDPARFVFVVTELRS